VVKVLPNGYVRGPFNVGKGVNSGGVMVETAQLSDGRLVLGGSFSGFANEAQNGVVVVTDGPMPPNITGVTPRNASAVVTFRAPSGDGGNPVLGMYINYANADYSSNGACTITSIIYDTAKALCTGLKNGTIYSIFVTAWNKETSGEPASIKVRPRTVPTAPRSLKVSFPSAKHAKVSWSVPASTGGVVIARYELCRSACTVAGSWHSVGVTAGKPNLSSVLALAKGTKVTVKVRAVNVAGAGAAAMLTFTQAK
jgi:titin